MKPTLILILLLSQLAIFFFTRPSEQSFKAITPAAPEATQASATFGSNTAPTFHDRYLFTTITQNNKTTHLGLLGHWFDLGSVKEAPPEKVELHKIKLP